MNELSRRSSIMLKGKDWGNLRNVTRVGYMSLFERGLNITITSGLKMMRIHLLCEKVKRFTLPETVAVCTCNKRWLEDFPF